MLRVIRSLARSIVTAIGNDPELRRSIDAHPGPWRAFTNRFDRAKPFGLRLTVGSILAIYFLSLFWGVAQDLLARDPLILADLRLMSVIQMFRSDAFNNAMLFATYLGSWQIVIAGAVLMSINLTLSRRWLWLVGMWISISGGEAIVWTLKYLFARPRPDLLNALLPASGGSFPSGHAFIAFCLYGFLAWCALCLVRRASVRVLILLACLLIIAAIGFSRVYLGADFPSDVLASFALGAAWLSILASGLSIAETRTNKTSSRATSRLNPLLAGLLPLIWASSMIAFYLTHPLPPLAQPVPQSTKVLSAADFPADFFTEAPRFSEDIVGAPMEPINVILMGNEVDITRMFGEAGWRATDRITPATIWRLVVAELGNHPYPQAPGTPSFWSGKPNQRGFEKPTSANTARERQHLHLWDTPFSLPEGPVWVATVHFDTSAKTANGVRLPIHQIDPAVDVQREALRVDLAKSECATTVTEAPVIAPMMGQNGAGSPFFTDGKTLVVMVSCGA